MKYVTRGLATHTHSALLLKVHGLLVERAGMGCLVYVSLRCETILRSAPEITKYPQPHFHPSRRCIVDRRTA
jgi:hypothetical protein